MYIKTDAPRWIVSTETVAVTGVTGQVTRPGGLVIFATADQEDQ